MPVHSYYGFPMSYQFLSVMSPNFFVQPCAALPEAAQHLFTHSLNNSILLTRPLHSLPYLSGAVRLCYAKTTVCVMVTSAQHSASVHGRAHKHSLSAKKQTHMSA